MSAASFKGMLLGLMLFPLLAFSQSTVDSFMYDGLYRNYRVFVPSAYQEGDSLPLVLNLHGYTSNATEQEFYTSFTAVADTGNFIVCHPNGINNSWNAGFGTGIDDVGFLSALIDTLHVQYGIQLDRVYSTGMSNGGYMSYKLACDLNDRIAAIASVTGSMTPLELLGCNPSNTIPVMQIHGTADPVVLYNGSATAAPIEDVVEFWRQNNGCSAQNDTLDLPDIDPTDGCTAQRITWGNCDNNHVTIFYKIDGGEHTWPGADFNIGVTNQDFKASEVIWQFFKQYPPQSPVNSASYDAAPQPNIALQADPNPFQDQLRVNTNNARFEAVRLYNSLGQIVWQTTNHRLPLTINTAPLPNGIYILMAVQEGAPYSLKVVKTADHH